MHILLVVFEMAEHKRSDRSFLNDRCMDESQELSVATSGSRNVRRPNSVSLLLVLLH